VIGFGPGRVARTKVAGLRSCTLTHGISPMGDLRRYSDRAHTVLSQAGAPLSWTSERADMSFVCERARKAVANERQPP